MTIQNTPSASSSIRKERRQRKYKGLLLCECCNRYSPVNITDWYELKDQEYIFLCNRPKCKVSRPENLIDTERYESIYIVGGELVELKIEG